ncbi:hypothetical protein BKA65DRAFT_514917 [Rhexocercosporidium sp. MPI-PUGE-AT-0058]|nr:hypothetical protein BKA65DRAFT_514917 [Rhexocercosporidium sp. MPI-PUGE-AT-0058]
MRPTLVRSMRPTLMRAAASAAKSSEGNVLNKGAKRDPELYILFAVMSGAFGLAGFYFGRKPTSATSESKVSIAAGSMPWQGEATEGDKARGDYKYKYHPGGDPKNPPKDAPSALHSVIVPNVNLPKELHDKYNKWGKDGY